VDEGADLIPALLALMQWGDRWQWPDERGPVRVAHAACDHEVRVEVRCPHCQRDLHAGELRARARGGVVSAPGEHEPGSVSARRLTSGEAGVTLDAERTLNRSVLD